MVRIAYVLASHSANSKYLVLQCVRTHFKSNSSSRKTLTRQLNEKDRVTRLSFCQVSSEWTFRRVSVVIRKRNTLSGASDFRTP